MAGSLRRFLFLSAAMAAAAFAVEEGPETAMVVTTEVGRVNEAVITAREFVEALRRQRFRQQPATEWRQAAWEECVRFKLVQLFARDLGRIDDVSETALRAAWAQENARRAAALAKQEVFFGPRQLTWEQFRSTWEDVIERDYGRRMLHSGELGPVAANDEYAAFAEALRRARAAANTSVETGRIARLDATTVLPEGRPGI
jgi:hypothetical protein